jgi:hypothetical protein
MKSTMLLALGLSVAHAAEPTGTLMLACEGMMTTINGPSRKEGPFTTSIIIDFASGTGEFDRLPIAFIFNVTETSIGFHVWVKPDYLTGTIDRMTGKVTASGTKSGDDVIVLYELKCKPTQRMF